MSTRNRARREQNRESKLAAAEEHLRRTKRQRVVFGVGGLLLAVLVALVLVVKPWDGGDGDSSASTTTTTGVASAAGKPCVATKGELPKGAPEVPVAVGPPPKELVKRDLKVGTGAVVKPDDTVTVDYIGVSCSTGEIFDASYFTSTPATLSFNEVIPGWKQGLPGIRVGGRRLLVVPPDLAYGSDGSEQIAPDETLWFVVTVNDAKPPATTTTT